MRKKLKYVALVLCVVCILATLPFFYVLPERIDPQGDGGGGCIVEALPSISNESRSIVASAHRAFCSDIVHDAAVYVYLHKSEERDSAQSLVFRYSDDSNGALPKITWIDNSSLSISVGEVIQITKMVPASNDVSIRYFVGHERVPREEWGTHVRNLELLAVGVIIFTVLISALTAILVRSVRKENHMPHP